MEEQRETVTQEVAKVIESPGGGRDYEAEIAKLRQEAAKYRTERNALKKQVGELSPAAAKLREIEEASKTAEQKQLDRMAELEAQLLQTKAAADLADKERKLVTLAVNAGVNSSLLKYLDVNKFNLEDEEVTLASLGELAQAQAKPSGGSPANPSKPKLDGSLSEDELRAFINGEQKSGIFG